MHIRWVVLVLLSCLLSWNGIVGCGKKRTINPPSQDAIVDQDGGLLPTSDKKNPPLPDDQKNIPEPKKPIPDPEPPPNLSCASIFECAKEKQCAHFPNVTCLDQCATEKKVSGVGLTRFNALKTCMTGNCGSCQPTDAACLTKCVLTNCAAAWMNCATDEQGGANNCKQASDCITACASDTDCVAKCLTQTAREAQTLYAKNKVCEEKLKNPATPPTEKTDCYRLNLSCECPSEKPGQGTGTCADFLTCVTPCGNDKCCVAKCRSSSAPTVLISADKFTLCASDKCTTACPAGDKKCAGECALEKCSSEYLNCQCPGVSGPGTGGGKCKTALTCSDKCSLTDTCCFARCTAQLSANSYNYYLRFIKCLPKCNCAPSDKSCLTKCAQGTCSSEAIKCYTK